MIYHYIKLFIRNILRQKGYSFINITGLSAGMAVGILMLLYVNHELSYDRFQSNSQNKYRINSIFEFSGQRFEADRSCGELVPRMLTEMPEVISAVSLYDESPYIRYKDKNIHENGGDVYFAHPSVCDFFSVKLVEGNPHHVFVEPFSIVITRHVAEKYFGQENPMGKMLSWNDNHQFKVTGIIAPYPDNSHLQFNILAPVEALKAMNGLTDLTKLGNSSMTYAEIRENSDLGLICSKLRKASYSFVPEKLKEQIQVSFSHYLQPVHDIHLYTKFGDFGDKPTRGRIMYVYIFSAIAIFILLLACVNFMNLTTARYAVRAKEVGLRKTLGACKPVLIRQFLGESVFMSFIALVTAVVLAELILPTFNYLIDKDLSLFNPLNLKILGGILLLGLIVGLLSGSYPAFFLTSFSPISVLKGHLKSGIAGKKLRWFLVIFQFIIALILAICTIVVHTQMNFIKNKDLGFNRDHLLVVRLRGKEIQQKTDVFSGEISKLPGITSYTFSSDKPGISTSWHGSWIFEEREEEEHPAFARVSIDDQYIKTLGLKITIGRNLTSEGSSDSSAMLINESMQNYLGWEDPLGKAIYEMDDNFNRKKYTVAGVIQDFHMESLHTAIEPMVFKLAPSYRYCLISLHPDNMGKTIEQIEEVWNRLFDH